MKICIMCKHFKFEGETWSYSELTPGADAGVGCWKGHFDELFANLDLNSYRKLMLKACDCKDYKRVKIEKKKEK